MRQKYEYDAFISHAVEDKIPIANELCAKLERAGLRVWYSGKELGIGDSIEKTIEKGLHRSRYGIVIFSPTYLAKNWTIREFYTLLAKEIKEHKVILPVLYNVTLDELKNKDLLMADRFAVNADRGIDFVVDKLVQEIKKPKVSERKLAWFSRIWLVLILSLLANVAFLVKGTLFTHQSGSGVTRDWYSVTSHEQTVGETLVGQMENLARTLDRCNCQDQGHFDKPIVRKASHQYSDINDAGMLTVSGTRTYKEQMPSRQAKKMTMAVVFQIETEAEPRNETVEEGLNEIFHTISHRPQEKREISLAPASDHSQKTCFHVHDNEAD